MAWDHSLIRRAVARTIYGSQVHLTDDNGVTWCGVPQSRLYADLEARTWLQVPDSEKCHTCLLNAPQTPGARRVRRAKRTERYYVVEREGSQIWIESEHAGPLPVDGATDEDMHRWARHAANVVEIFTTTEIAAMKGGSDALRDWHAGNDARRLVFASTTA